jgi:hypothetical protein
MKLHRGQSFEIIIFPQLTKNYTTFYGNWNLIFIFTVFFFHVLRYVNPFHIIKSNLFNISSNNISIST